VTAACMIINTHHCKVVGMQCSNDDSAIRIATGATNCAHYEACVEGIHMSAPRKMCLL